MQWCESHAHISFLSKVIEFLYVTTQYEWEYRLEGYTYMYMYILKSIFNQRLYARGMYIHVHVHMPICVHFGRTLQMFFYKF